MPRGSAQMREPFLLHVLLVVTPTAATFGSNRLPLVAARAATSVWGSDCKVNVFLAIRADHKGRNVDNLLADPDVAVADEDTSVVD